MRIRPTRRTFLTAGLVLTAGAGFAGRPSPGTAAAGATRAGLAFGTTVSVTAFHPDAGALPDLLTAAFREIRKVERAMNLFDPASDLSRLNRTGVLERPDPGLLEALRLALNIARLTDGAFDPTIQPLWTLWASGSGQAPAAAEIEAARALVNHRDVLVGRDHVTLARPGMALTLNGIAQGYAADKVVAALEQGGAVAAFVDTGEYGARGRRPDGRDWRLGIAHPRRPAEIAEVIAPFAGFAATSGDSDMVFTPDRREHHILDPRTGHSPPDCAAVTVEAPSGALADALSTAAFVLGPEAGSRLVDRFADCRCRMWLKEGAGARPYRAA